MVGKDIAALSASGADVSRYARQEIFAGIGEAGQKKIQESRVVILGLSGLGTMTAEYLARAGVGTIRLVDGDYVEYIELQRESLFTEEDAVSETPRAAAAAGHLAAVNSQIKIETAIAAPDGSSIEHFISDADLVIDASDSMEMRLLINEACHALKKPWIYGGALASTGTTCNFLPGDDMPCMKCMLGDQVYDEGSQPTCATVGVLMPVIGVIASVQAAEALKILTGSEDVRRDILNVDVWSGLWTTLPLTKNPDCPVCVKEQYELYGKDPGSQIQALCGKDSVQIIPQTERNIDFEAYAKKLEKQGSVTVTRYTLTFDDGHIAIKLFKNGRAIIKRVTDEARARAAYREYIGL